MTTTLLSGAAFGAAFTAAGFHQPAAIISLFRLENSHMAQAFVTATASSAIIYPILHRLGLVPRLQPRSCSPLFGFLTSYDGNILGGALLGAGMALASACPGTLLVQTALGVKAGVAALAGSVLGGVIWSGLLRESIKARAEDKGVKSHTFTLQEKIGVSEEAMVVLFETACISAVGAAATYADTVPWAVFPGVIGGLFIGGAQLLSLLTRKSMIGISGSYEEIGNYVSWILKGMPSKSRPSAYKNITFGVGCMLGAWALRFTAPQYVLPPIGEVPAGQAFFGGVSMIIGSRMAGGCTGGHGISGMSLMSVSSAVTMASAFAGGVLVAQWL